MSSRTWLPGWGCAAPGTSAVTATKPRPCHRPASGWVLALRRRDAWAAWAGGAQWRVPGAGYGLWAVASRSPAPIIPNTTTLAAPPAGVRRQDHRAVRLGPYSGRACASWRWKMPPRRPGGRWRTAVVPSAGYASAAGTPRALRPGAAPNACTSWEPDRWASSASKPCPRLSYSHAQDPDRSDGVTSDDAVTDPASF